MKTFVHTIGGYYKDPDKFIRESRETGVNRRIAVHLLKGFEFGDVVMTLQWNGGKPKAFGQFTVERLSFQEPVMVALAVRLLADGEGDMRDGGGAVVERECGSYIDAGGVVLRRESKLTLQDLLARAKAIAVELGIPKLETFIGGRFQAYKKAVKVPKPPFQMGYWEVDEAKARKRGAGEREVAGIGSYHLRTRVGRTDPLLGLKEPEPKPTAEDAAE